MKQDISAKSDFKIYIKFNGPEANKGRVDIEKAGRTMIAFSRLLKKYTQECKKGDIHPSLKIEQVSPGSTDLILSIVDTIQNHPLGVGGLFWGTKMAFENFGIKAFFESFMKTTGEQLSLKIFSKNKPVEQGKIEGTKIYLINSHGEKKSFEYESWLNYQILAPYFNDLYNLEEGKEDIMKIGYQEGDKSIEVAQITVADKEYFTSPDSYGRFSDRLEENFDEKNTVQRKITGVFVDYYGLAHKYHFSFQARKNQDDIGKQKILCIVDHDVVSRAIDYLKPENNHNITIFGNAVLDTEGKVDKIKILWISNNPNYDPNQTTFGS